eukprot:TRINITY_DN66921_c3_g2_i1.p1 TRINITY_DN66921_c3_g2~~TRINITY_DN66921_c3_g2_i1.p1  ORF type:complete len:156 (+),score=11.06 TRINITY_DN66921_c3_g2_i1:135-602(+)
MPSSNPTRAELAKEASLQGSLMKLGAVHKTWKERWFVLKGSKLYYYKTSAADKHISEISIDQAVIRTSKELYPQHFCFEIVTAPRVYQLIAKKDTEMWVWVRELQKMSQITRENEIIGTTEDMIRHLQSQLSMVEHQILDAENANQTTTAEEETQ